MLFNSKQNNNKLSNQTSVGVYTIQVRSQGEGGGGVHGVVAHPLASILKKKSTVMIHKI